MMSTPNASESLVRTASARIVERARGLAASQRPYLLDYIILGAVFVVMYVSIIRLQQQFFPDSAHYLAMSLWFSGMPRDEAFALVVQKSIDNGYTPHDSPEMIFDWGLVKPRVVLSVLSVPFMWVFGENGLGVTTGVITAVLFTMLYVFLRNRYGRVAAIASLLLSMSGLAIMTFSIGMLTESLSALWGVLALILAYRFQRDRARRWIILLVVVTLLSAFTRQATFIVAGAFVVAWALSLFAKSERSKWGWPALAVAATSLIAQVVQTALFPFSQADQYLAMTKTDSIGEAIAATPAFVAKLALDEFKSYVLADQVMVVFVVLTVVSMVVFWRRTETHLLLGAILGIALYNITNGNATHFRYAIPGLVFFLASISLLLAQVQSTARLNRAGSVNDLDRPDLDAPVPETPTAA